MKNSGLVLNIVLLVLVGVLFFLHFSSNKEVKPKVQGVQDTRQADGDFHFAYFEWDSLENHFDLFKEYKNELNQREESNTREKMRLRQMYQNKMASYPREMSQVESEIASREVQKLQSDIQNQMNEMDQKLQEESARRQSDLRSKIEAYLKEYNKDKNYKLIVMYEPSLIYYRDSTCNITTDLIKGLNAMYAKKK